MNLTKNAFSIVIVLMMFCSCNLFRAKDWDRDFAVSDTASIQKIFIADKGNHTISLEKKSGVWFVNGKYKTRKDAIALLLAGLKDIKVNRPVAIQAHNMVVKDMAANALKVEIFGAENKLLKAYFVGAPTNDYSGNYYLMKDSDQPYIVEIPGFNGYISVRYILEEQDWRDRNLFTLQPSEIKKIAINYFDERKAESFAITQINLDNYEIAPTAAADNKKCFFLFEQFKNLNALNYAKHRDIDDSARVQHPFAELILTTANGEEKKVELVHASVTEHTKQQFDPNGRPMNFDNEIYYAWANNRTDFLLIQDLMLRHVLKLRKDFLK